MAIKKNVEKTNWDEMVQITIPNKYNDESGTMFVGVNNYIANIPRGKAVTVPRYVAEAIKYSIESDEAAYRRRKAIAK